MIIYQSQYLCLQLYRTVALHNFILEINFLNQFIFLHCCIRKRVQIDDSSPTCLDLFICMGKVLWCSKQTSGSERKLYSFILQVLQLWLVSQNLSFIVAGGTVIALIANPAMKLNDFPTFVSLVVLVNISGAVGALSTLAGTILVERDW